MDLASVALRLGIALFLGTLIGFERQWHQKTAGLRTNALVALGAAGFVVFSTLVDKGDPTRVAAQIVSGIGFLGAGVILREGLNVHGLTTAATVWCSAMIGTLAGAGYLAQSAVAAAFVVGTHIFLRPLVQYLQHRETAPEDNETRYTIKVTCRASDIVEIRRDIFERLHDAGINIRRINSETLADQERASITIKTSPMQQDDAAIEGVTGPLNAEPKVIAASWQSDAFTLRGAASRS